MGKPFSSTPARPALCALARHSNGSTVSTRIHPFPDQPTNLYNEGFKYCILKLQDEDIVWLVKYLD